MEIAPTVLDARGRKLEEGDEVILVSKGPIYFRIARISSVLNKEMPAGMLKVDAGAMVSFLAHGGQVNAEFIRVRTREEAGPTPMVLMDREPEGEEQP